MKQLFLACAMIALVPGFAYADEYRSQSDFGTAGESQTAQTSSGANEFTGPKKGTREITLNGTGTTDNDLDSGTFGLSGSYGWYHSDALMFAVRQTVDWAGARNQDDDVSASTRLAVDYHFNGGTRSHWRPFVGLNVGYVYGGGVDETFAAGPEAGIKYYVNDTTFVLVQTEYRYHFDSGGEIDDNFDDGSFVHTVGLGFNF